MGHGRGSRRIRRRRPAEADADRAGLRAVWLQTHDEAEPAFASALAERAGLPADDVRPVIWAAMLNAALRAAVEHHTARSTDPDVGPASITADLEATLRTALAVAAAGIT